MKQSVRSGVFLVAILLIDGLVFGAAVGDSQQQSMSMLAITANGLKSLKCYRPSFGTEPQAKVVPRRRSLFVDLTAGPRLADELNTPQDVWIEDVKECIRRKNMIEYNFHALLNASKLFPATMDKGDIPKDGEMLVIYKLESGKRVFAILSPIPSSALFVSCDYGGKETPCVTKKQCLEDCWKLISLPGETRAYIEREGGKLVPVVNPNDLMQGQSVYCFFGRYFAQAEFESIDGEKVLVRFKNEDVWRVELSALYVLEYQKPSHDRHCWCCVVS